MKNVKLDGYDYELWPSNTNVERVYIWVDANDAVEIADISTELNQYGGKIYVDGIYLQLIKTEVTNSTMILYVKERE